MKKALVEFKGKEGAQISPVSFYVSSSCNVIVWEPKVSVENVDFEKVKEAIAGVMDSLIDKLKEYEEFSPLVGLICIAESNSNSWNELIGDQDWHRGRFALKLIYLKENETYQYQVDEWLGDLQTEPYRFQ